MEKHEVFETDVLIVGGGGAGVRAAIEASNCGAEVCLVSKGPIARSGLTPLAYPSLQAAFGTNDSRDNPEVHYQDIIAQGRGLSDQNLARVLADESISRAMDLEGFGIKFRKQDGRLFQVHHPGQTYPRNLWIVGGGFGLIQGLKKELLRCSKTKIFEDFCVSHLLKDKGEVVGAFGLNMRDGRFYAIAAKATVLCCGGYEELWGNSDAAPDSTGDGVFLGFQAGAEVIDLEMVQYYPTVLAYPESVKGVLIHYETFLERRYLDFRLVNNNEREFLPEGPLPARDDLMRLILAEIEKGQGTKHNAVYIDPLRSSKSQDEINDLIHQFLEGPNRNLRKLGIEIRKDRLEVSPAVHHTLGGVRINEKTETSVPGLFAAGENASNLHGGNRISGNALSETQVFGARAGKYAARYSEKKGRISPSSGEIRQGIHEWIRFLEKKGKGCRPLLFKQELKQAMDRFIGPNRNQEGMEKALQRVSDLKQNGLTNVEATGERVYNLDWRDAMEVFMMLDLAELVIRSALLRRETRGHHFRSDYPETSNRPQHTLITKRGQKVTVNHTPVKVLNP